MAVVVENNEDLISILHAQLPPGDDFIFSGADMEKSPIFTMHEVAHVFFQRSTQWLRWREGKKYFTKDLADAAGNLLPICEPKRKVPEGRDPESFWGTRQFNLADVEILAHRLQASGAITASRMLIALNMLMLCGYGYGVLSPDVRRIDGYE